MLQTIHVYDETHVAALRDALAAALARHDERLDLVALGSRSELDAARAHVEVLFASRPPRDGWAGFARLRLIHLAGAGADGLLPSPDLSSRVAVAGARGLFAAEASEHVIAALLAWSRASFTVWDRQRERAWRSFAVAARVIGLRANVWGISPLSSVGDSVSNYPEEVDYEKDIAESYARFGLGRPQLLRSYSTDEASCQFVASRAWDLIYIDGSHDEGVVAHDYSIASAALREGGVLVFDDAALEFGYLPGPQSFAGHPGPSSVANRIAAKEMDLVAVVGHNVVFRKR